MKEEEKMRSSSHFFSLKEVKMKISSGTPVFNLTASLSLFLTSLVYKYIHHIKHIIE